MTHPYRRRSPAHRAANASAGNTSVSIAGKPVPPLPHEADESADSTANATDEKVEQAYVDLKRGLVDTDKGPPMGRAYDRLKKTPGN